MKLLFFTHETTWSGAPIQLFHLVTWLKQSGHQVAVAVPKPTTAESGPLSDEFGRVGVEIYPLLDLSTPPELAEMQKLCARFDVVVANTLVMSAAVRAAHAEGVPVLWYIHESLIAEHLIAHIPEIRPALELTDLLVMPTQRTAALYARWTARPIEVVAYGIPPAVAASSLTTADSNRCRFLLLGTYEPRKGQDVFLEAIGKLEPALRARATFGMAGRVLDRDFHENLARQARSIPEVELLGALSHDEALVVTAASDVLVCASRDETMPVAILEAMSLGKAIVTATVGGVTEWLRDGVNALLVPPEDRAALAVALGRCLTDAELVASLGENGRRTFEKDFSLEQLGRRFTALFERVRRTTQT